MWTFDDASRLSSDMDSRRASPSYGSIGFEACDPLGCVPESPSGRRGPARIVRRRCRSEGVDRSPYEDAREPHSADHYRERARPHHTNKTYFTLLANASTDRFQHECQLPQAHNGDFLMASEHNKYFGYPPGRSKTYRKSPTRPLLVTTLSNTKVDDRLPKVEELLEKIDHEMIDIQTPKQPLKSILNNPLPKSPPPGILKKPKNKAYQDPKTTVEGRRRQRAASESDNFYCSFHLGSPIPGYDSRLSYIPSNQKRAKDNSGCYSYGSAIASLSSAPRCKSPTYNKSRCGCKDSVVVTNGHRESDMHLLRTTAINNDLEVTSSEMSRQDTPTPASSAISPALPVSAVTGAPAKKPAKPAKKKVKPKTRGSKMKMLDCSIIEEGEDALSRSPSPDTLNDPWQMDTDPLPAPPPSEDRHPPPAHLKDDDKTLTSVSPTMIVKHPSSNKINGIPPVVKKVSKDSPLNLPDSISSSLRLSLFPRVPPYLKFVSYDESAPIKIPSPIQKHLKWKLTTITPIVVQKTLTNSGFRLVKSECDTAECPQEETVEWIGIWGKHMKSLMFRAIKDGQKMNHFPGTFQIGRKDRLWRNLQKLATKWGVEEFGIMPKTYVLPHDMKLLKHDWQKYSANNERWIIKPPASARGTGIKVVSRWTQIPKKRPVVVQRYISKPYLINGNKFDMRLYVLVTSVHPLRIYLYKDGLARFASVKYNDEITSLNDRYMHLTNYSINRLSKNYTPNEDFASCEGHKWTLQTLFHYLKTEKNVNVDRLWESMKDLVIKTIISGEASISSLTKANITSRYNCYELFGIDVLLDEDLKPWLLEVNISPSLHSASPLDKHVKGPLVTTVLNIAQFQIPMKTNLEMLSKDKPHKLAGLPYDSRLYTVYLSKEERDKHIIYTNMEDRDMYLRDILSTLTPDDVRHLLQAEDELTQTGDMERVFPTNGTHKYLVYLAGARYYNRLFDAWETRYANNRPSGIELLRNLCDIGYHLEVPPVPLKVPAPAPAPAPRPPVARAACRMTWTRRRRPRPNASHLPSPRWRRRGPRRAASRPAAETPPCASPPPRRSPSPSSRAHSVALTAHTVRADIATQQTL